MNNLIAVGILAILAQHPEHSHGRFEPITAGWVIGQNVQGPRQSADKLFLSTVLTEPEAINRASAVFVLDKTTVFIDPVGPQDQYRRFGRPDIVVLTRARASHLSINTMIGLLRRDTVVLAPQTVIDELPLMISNNVIAPFEVGSTQEVDGITFRALPRSAPIPFGAAVYQRDRGDIGVLMEVDGAFVYF